MIVTGTVTKKMAPVLVTLYEQMPSPKWVIAMGNCAISGGPFVFEGQYNIIEGVDLLVPVDVYVPGCPQTGSPSRRVPEIGGKNNRDTKIPGTGKPMVERMKTELGAALEGISIAEANYRERGYHLSLEAAPGELLKAARFFDERGFYLAAIVCVDYKEYLELVYIFSNHASLCKVKVALKIDPAKPVAPTISTIFDCAYWHEREIREFFGVLFDGHPNMTYLFLHDGIDSYPLRKETDSRFRRR